MKLLSVILAAFLATITIFSAITAADTAQNPGPEIIKFKDSSLRGKLHESNMGGPSCLWQIIWYCRYGYRLFL